MDIFIYFFSQLNYGLDELEDAINDELDGIGEVTGVGSGKTGSNIDIEIFDKNKSIPNILDIIRKSLKNFILPASSIIKINGDEYKL